MIESVPQIVKEVGKRMPRARHQRGWVEEAGKRRRKWRGHYYVYVRQPDGTERRQHRAVVLGLKSEMPKWKAEAALQAIIEREIHTSALPAQCTLRWFWQERFCPMKAPKWKASARGETVKNIERYIIAPLGELPLASIDKFTLQTHINSLAKNYSRSVVEKALIWSRAILEEAVDQDLLNKNPGWKLEMPETRKVNRKTVNPERVAEAFATLPMRERLMLRIALVLGLRPGEILALRWNDIFPHSLRIDEATVDGSVYAPKTEASIDHVWMPAEIKAELDFWRSAYGDPKPESFIFPSPTGRVMRLDNYRRRMFRPALEKAGLKGVTFQQCRRSCATLLLDGKHGNLKDVQRHLRHAQATTTLGIYVQEVPASVRAAVESLDKTIFGKLSATTSLVN